MVTSSRVLGKLDTTSLRILKHNVLQMDQDYQGKNCIIILEWHLTLLAEVGGWYSVLYQKQPVLYRFPDSQDCGS